MRFAPLAFLVAAILAAFTASADAAEVYAKVLNGEKFAGDVPAGADIRLGFLVAAGAEPRLSFSLSTTGPTVTFTETHLYGPDGNEILFDPRLLKPSFPKKGVSSLSFKGYTTTAGGEFQFLVRTNARQLTKVSGRFTTARPAKVPFAGDQNSVPPANPVTVSLLQGDGVTITVTRTSGTAPKIVHYAYPDGQTAIGDSVQKISKKGASYRVLWAPKDGDYKFTVGYQGLPAEGSWKGTLKIRSLAIKGGIAAPLRLRNSPGVPLSVFDNDRTAKPTWGGAGAGVATDGFNVLVTSESGGSLFAQFLDRELATLPTMMNPVSIAGAADMSVGETLVDHRVMSMGGSFYVSFSSSTGQSLSLLKLNNLLQRNNSAQVLSQSASSTRDFFMTGDGANVALGVATPATGGHRVELLDAANFGTRSTVLIGGGLLPQSAGSGAAWRPTDAVFELWTPDTLDYHGPSDLHRQLYQSTWTAASSDSQPVAEAGTTETSPTAVVVDPITQATILHYVVPDNPPLVGGKPGSGRIHRRLFNTNGVEIAGSHFVLPNASCLRPTAMVFGAYLYVAFETPSGFEVQRWQLLR
jgi:hypothetical protein